MSPSLAFCSPFYKDRAYFGGYPSLGDFQELVTANFKYLVDLTTTKEHSFLSFTYQDQLSKYTDIVYIHFPIRDNDIPLDKQLFMNFIIHLEHLLQQGGKMYIHCKGGHGRSGLVVSSLLCYLHNMVPEKALGLTTCFHAERPNLKEKWKHVRCPQTYRQRQFVMELFQPVSITSHDYNTQKNHQEFMKQLELRPLRKQSSNMSVIELLGYLRKLVNQRHLIIS